MAIDWQKQKRFRREATKQYDDPLVYLLLPEMVQLLDVIENKRQKLFFKTLWLTGAKASEIISIKARNISIKSKCVQLTIESRSKPESRQLVIYDSKYRRELVAYLKVNTRKQNDRLWDVTRQTPARWLSTILTDNRLSNKAFVRQSITLSAFRNSFAINWLLHSAPVHMLVDIMCFKQPDSAAQYVRYLSYDKNKEYRRVKFS